MKEIKAIIQPFRLEAVKAALGQIPNLPAITLSMAQGLATESGLHSLVVKTKLELMVTDGQVEPVIRAIQMAAHTGNPGDGRIFVIPVEKTVKIRTGEMDTTE